MHSCHARDPRKASFIDLTAHHVVRSRARSLSRSAARAHVREAIHLTGDPISRAVENLRQFCARRKNKLNARFDRAARKSAVAQAALLLLEISKMRNSNIYETQSSRCSWKFTFIHFPRTRRSAGVKRRGIGHLTSSTFDVRRKIRENTRGRLSRGPEFTEVELCPRDLVSILD